MPEKNPETWSLISWLWIIGLSLLGGVVQFYRKVQLKVVRVFNFTELFGELATSAFAGIITLLLCEYAGFSVYLTAALCGVAGHMGSRAIFILEGMFQQRLNLPGPPHDNAGK